MKSTFPIKYSICNQLNKLALFCILLFSTNSFAQKNTDVKSVDIVSAYRPKIGSLSKFQFIPTLPAADSAKLTTTSFASSYPQLPVYAVTSMRPLAYAADTALVFNNRFYAKVGYGNLRSPLLKLFYNRVVGTKQGYQASFYHEGAKGKLPFQSYNQTRLSLDGFKQFSTAKVGAGVVMKRDNVYQYGFRKPLTTLPAPVALKNIYSSLHFQLRAEPIQFPQSGIAYSGQFEGGFFFDQRSTQEKFVRASVPLEKKWNDKWSASMHLKLQQTSLASPKQSTLSNSLATANLLLSHWGRLVTLQAGAQPSVDRDGFALLPQLRGVIKIDSARLAIDGGVEGSVQFRSFESLYQENNWINLPSQLKNTRTTRFILGAAGSFNSYLSYRIQTAWSRIENMPLFVNDTSSRTDGSSFHVLVEPRMKQFQLSGTLHYQTVDRFAIHSTIAAASYSGLQQQRQAWGLLPLEWKTTLHVALLNKLSMDLESMVWRGALFLQTDGKAGRSKGAADINTQLVYNVHPSWQIWTRFNNLFNQTYQRWNQYPVYGLNFMAGIVFSPEPKR